MTMTTTRKMKVRNMAMRHPLARGAGHASASQPGSDTVDRDRQKAEREKGQRERERYVSRR